jgi:DNA-binding transcriptional LysR family regulator
MVLRHLEYLVALAREKHFRRAAEACGVSQPTLSAGIRRLEAELGVLIVRRDQRFEGLTPEGQRVLEWALRVVADTDGLRDEVQAMRTGLSGRLRIGAIPTSLSSVSLLTTPFLATHPDVRVSVHSMNSRQIERALQDFELELGITYLDSEPLTAVRGLPLYRERYLLLTSAKGPFGRHRTVRWADAARVPLTLLTEDMQNRRIVNSVFAQVGAAPVPNVETNSISTLYAHVRDGPWSSVVSQMWLRLFDVPAGLRAIPLVEPQAVRSIGLVVLDRDPEPLLARAMLDLARTLDLGGAAIPGARALRA